jgi:hypothetical protein
MQLVEANRATVTGDAGGGLPGGGREGGGGLGSEGGLGGLGGAPCPGGGLARVSASAPATLMAYCPVTP